MIALDFWEEKGKKTMVLGNKSKMDKERGVDGGSWTVLFRFIY